MSTRSSITLKDGEKFISVYCHWDGYVANNGVLLQTNYNTIEKIKELLTKGDMSCLRETVADTLYYVDYGEERVKPREYYTVRDMINYEWQEYNYLFVDGKWMFSRDDSTMFQDLESEIASIKIGD